MKNETDDNVIIKMTFAFAMKIIDFCDELDNIKKSSLSNQLFRSGASIGSNAREALNAESKVDTINKFKMSAKEAEATEYWLLLCKVSNKLPDSSSLLSDLEVIKKELSKIIDTYKKKSTIGYR